MLSVWSGSKLKPKTQLATSAEKVILVRYVGKIEACMKWYKILSSREKKAFEVVISKTVNSAYKLYTATRYMYMKDFPHILYTSAEVHVHVGYST